MRKCRLFLVMLLLLCTLLNSTACFLQNSFAVFSDEARHITLVVGTKRDQIGIVLDDIELVVCNYKGKELCRRSFKTEITHAEIYEGCALIQFNDNSIEVYSLENNEFQLLGKKSFSSEIKKAELFDWMIDENKGVFVLLSNGELWQSEAGKAIDSFTLLDAGICSEAYMAHYLTYISDDGTIHCWSAGEFFDTNSLISPDVLKDIYALEVARFGGRDSVIGYGREKNYIINTLGDNSLEKIIDKDEMDVFFSKKGVEWSVLYHENEKWYYEGVTKDYKHLISHEKRKTITVPDGKLVFLVAGGVITYDEHEVKIQLVSR